MKMNRSLILIFLICSFAAVSQESATEKGMAPRVYNFTSFSLQQSPNITSELISLTPSEFQTHPEFGKVPYNTQSANCIELLHKRTENSRYFVKNGTNGNTFFVQQGYSQLHYKDSHNNLLSIDARLRPSTSKTATYHAPDQEMPTLIDVSTGSTSIKLKPFELAFNVHPKIYQIDGVNETPLFGNINMANTTVGEDGAFTLNAWQGINRTVMFDRGQIKTNFVLSAAPSLPSNNGWLAFEDEIDLPSGYKIITDNAGAFTPEGYWQGDLKLISETSQQEFARWSSVIIYDNNGSQTNISNAAYQLKIVGNKYFVRTMVKISWLNNISTVYPVTIDPLVSGTNTWTAGQIGFTPYAPGTGFCGSSSAFCLGGPLNVIFPGAATITNVLWSSQYIAINPTLMQHGGFRMVGPCGENPILTNNWWSCAIAFSGTCSGVNNVVPNLATCLAASCNTTTVAFFTKNIHCNNVVAGVCNTARLFFVNNSWIVTVEGQNLATLTNTTTGNGTAVVAAVCLGTVVLDPNAQYSVGPYTYLWNPGGATTPTLNFTPVAPGNNTVTCQVTDACGVVRTATFTITNNCVLPLELTEFYLNYNGETCDVNWTTATEKNSDYFLIEKSSDAVNYTLMEKVEATGNSSQTKKYVVRDNAPDKENITYYRLKQFNVGSSEPFFTLVETLKPKEKAIQKITLQPNPANSNIDVFLPAPFLNRNVTLQVFDNSGKRVFNIPVNRTSSNSAYNLNLETLQNGMYSIHVFDESGNSSKTTFVRE